MKEYTKKEREKIRVSWKQQHRSFTSKIIRTLTTYERVGRRFVPVELEQREVTHEEHFNYITAAPFFRRLGGSEYQERTYTPIGYIVTRAISQNPDRSIKKVARFEVIS